ncbi:DUF5360 family protein [Paenibacillus hodogayensis]|uniref:DUF5360 family protein n=1 Tax=Paenibacillus hodogayensis TaxID=279208 RepID=A0ABV5VY55_9BACL
MGKTLKGLMWFTDIGFVLYWAVTFSGLIPESYLYLDYRNELLVAWNLSFIPLDLIISATGLLSLHYYHRRNPLWSSLCMTSLLLTSCSGLQAIAFWVIRRDFDIMWWIPNLFLLLYPLFFLGNVMKGGRTSDAGSNRGRGH